MREILFRAKKISDKKWIEGGIVVLDPGSEYVFISEPFYSASTLPVRELIYDRTHLVNKETVGQYTGLTDKNGKKIFEGDIIKYTDEITDKEKIAQIEYCEKQASFVRVYKSKMGLQYLYINERIANKSELIGNIFDNPELLTED